MTRGKTCIGALVAIQLCFVTACGGESGHAPLLDDSETSMGGIGGSFNVGNVGGSGGTFTSGGSGGSSGRGGSGGNGGSGGEGASEGGGGQGNTDAQFILGSWVQNVGDCEYVHTFDDRGVYTMTSTTGEEVRANYELMAPSSAGGRWRLDFTITFDNNVIDCEGQKIDETGDAHTAYVLEVEANHLGVYRDASGGSPAFVWEKL